MHGHRTCAVRCAFALSALPMWFCTFDAHLLTCHTDVGLVTVVDQGRHRYFTLADGHVAHLLETLSLTGKPMRDPVRGNGDPVLIRARTCYDHLAGRLGVALFAQLQTADCWALTGDAVR